MHLEYYENTRYREALTLIVEDLFKLNDDMDTIRAPAVNLFVLSPNGIRRIGEIRTVWFRIRFRPLLSISIDLNSLDALWVYHFVLESACRSPCLVLSGNFW